MAPLTLKDMISRLCEKIIENLNIDRYEIKKEVIKFHFENGWTVEIKKLVIEQLVTQLSEAGQLDMNELTAAVQTLIESYWIEQIRR